MSDDGEKVAVVAAVVFLEVGEALAECDFVMLWCNWGKPIWCRPPWSILRLNKGTLFPICSNNLP